MSPNGVTALGGKKNITNYHERNPVGPSIFVMGCELNGIRYQHHGGEMSIISVVSYKTSSTDNLMRERAVERIVAWQMVSVMGPAVKNAMPTDNSAGHVVKIWRSC